MVRAGLTSMLGTRPEMEVVGIASGASEALALLNSVEADVMLIDLRMPGMTVIETIREASRRSPTPRTIVLTNFETDEDVYRSVEVGAHGYLLKNTSEEEMVEAIRVVPANGRYFPPGIAARLAERIARSRLTAREEQILQMLAEGLTNKEIGRGTRNQRTHCPKSREQHHRKTKGSESRGSCRRSDSARPDRVGSLSPGTAVAQPAILPVANLH